jgi:hypothetical protein
VTVPPKLHNKIGADIVRAPELVGSSLLAQLYNLVDAHTTVAGKDSLDTKSVMFIYLTVSDPIILPYVSVLKLRH